jgi:uncharacterized protein
MLFANWSDFRWSAKRRKQSDPRFRLPVRRSDRNLAVARAISYRVLGRRQHSVPLTGILTRMAHSPSELVWLVLALLAGGALTGILAGLFGIGGGTIMVPVLYQLFDFAGVPEAVRMHLCIGTSLAAIIPTCYRAYRAHDARGAVDRTVLRRWTPPIMLGATVGTVVAAAISSAEMRVIFAALCTANGLRFAFGREHWRIANELPGRLGMTVYGLAIGMASALMGISGGQFMIMFMTLHNRPIHQAVATSAGLGIAAALPGTIGFALTGLPEQALMPPLSIGYVSLIGAALIAIVSVLTAPVGVRLAHRFSRKQLELAFGGYLLLIAARFAVSL